MFEKMIKKFTEGMHIEQEFDDKNLLFVTRTYFGGRLLSEYEMDIEPMFDAFKKRLER